MHALGRQPRTADDDAVVRREEELRGMSRSGLGAVTVVALLTLAGAVIHRAPPGNLEVWLSNSRPLALRDGAETLRYEPVVKPSALASRTSVTIDDRASAFAPG